MYAIRSLVFTRDDMACRGIPLWRPPGYNNKMKISYEGNCMTIGGLAHFSLAQCLNCGQTFRWKRADGGFSGVALGRPMFVRQTGDVLTLDGIGEAAGAAFLRYFDLERDYGAIMAEYADDPFLAEGMAFAQGLRVLRQPPFEALITFIISANNNIARITGIVDRLCRRFGVRLGDDAYDFPTPGKLASADIEALKACGAGYRARYISDTAKAVCSGFDLGGLAALDFEQARQKLTQLCGVGLKVADCVCLYGLGFLQAFPMDVWMNRVLCGAYGYTGTNDRQMRAFVDEKFGAHAGIAQQYLFHYARNNKDAICKT